MRSFTLCLFVTFFVFVCCDLLCACELYILFIVFLLISATIVLYCMALVAYCNPASIMMGSMSSPVFMDNGSVKLCVCMCIRCYICDFRLLLQCK